MSQRSFLVAELSDERPSERLLHRGADTLSDAELLACVLGSSTPRRDTLDLARTLVSEGLDTFTRREYATATQVSDLGLPTAARLAAVVAVSRRIASRPPSDRALLGSPERVAAYLLPHARDWPEERVGVLLLDARHRLIADREVVRGSLDSAVVSPRDILRRCLAEGAAGFLVYHNHPSGDPTPSRDDIDFTRALATAAKQVGVKLLDHVVVGREGCVSMATRGLLDLS